MSDARIAERWARIRSARRTALIPYLTAGYPSLDRSREALRMVAEAGADFVEVGIPFSDPVADGPIIQRANQIALGAGMNLEGTLALVRGAQLPVPVILFGYLNPMLAYGLKRFLDDAEAAGASGLLITDLPAGEDADIEAVVAESGLALIRLIAPTTSEVRCRRILRNAEGFVYLIARLGVTGARTELQTSLSDAVAALRRMTSLSVAVGFGIGDATQAAALARVADGVVVGSALVRRLEQGVGSARSLMQELRTALDSDRSEEGAA